MATTESFEATLKECKEALLEAYRERNAIEQRIVSLKQVIDGLALLCEPEAFEEVLVNGGNLPDGYGTSLTDAIRRIFLISSEPMLTPPEVRDALLKMGVNIAKYKQPLVPIHNSLKRLVVQEELAEFRDDNNELRGYRLVSSGTARLRSKKDIFSHGTLADQLGDGDSWLHGGLPANDPSHPLRNPPPMVKVTPKK